MKQNDFMKRGAVMRTADSKLHHYICRADFYLRCAQEYLDDYRDLGGSIYYDGLRAEWPEMARLYESLAKAEIRAARILISDLEDVGLLDRADWRTINHWLVWFNAPSVDSYA